MFPWILVHSSKYNEGVKRRTRGGARDLCTAEIVQACCAGGSLLPAGTGDRERSHFLVNYCKGEDMKTLVAALLATAAHFSCAAKPMTSIPPAFHGEWNIDLKDCNTDLNDSRLWIGQREVKHYEGRDDILVVVAKGTRELALIAQTKGEKNLTTLQYELSRDRTQLIDIRNEPRVIRYRCPSAKVK